ncbi:sensor histidine kinase [Halothermothrix orenii]|uniref:histidine kinase n=1 Tax=Halothermothrix orenii (strain H 168 / OCM 544 / DSM 9562) TaxID=373903 RepID=B8CWX8_HALOH|nr:sensor histidine kinase [Halothermothrix orenii]ACL69797.1 signal transduction histidine kinase, LytS [Halothermothrix orenii H 168]
MSAIDLETGLLFILVRNMGVVVTFAYILSMTRLFKRFFYAPLSRKEKIFLVIFFGLLSASGTYLSIYIMDAYANIRAIGAVVAGFLGGPLIGVLVGTVGGIHRFTLGGFTALACAIGTMTSGLIGGLFHKSFKNQQINSKNSFYIGAVALIIEMVIVIIFSRPIELALQLVSVISLPMIIANAAGISLFVSILNNVEKENENIKAKQARLTLDIANQTINYFREGLAHGRAVKKASEIILQKTGASAVAITDREKIIAFAGKGSDHHFPGEPFLTSVTRQTINEGKVSVAKTKKEVGCPVENCPLESVVVAPLKWDGRVMGSLKLYHTERKLSKVDISLAEGISTLLSTQIQLSRLSEQAKLKTEAELKALQAQVNPHFLFNSLNTIASFTRTDPEKARELLLRLSDFFRTTLSKGHDLVSLETEIKSVRNYFFLEKARFGERLELVINIPDEYMSVMIPSFTLQPLIENAVKHGIFPKNRKGKIDLSVRSNEDIIELIVRDNGVGIPEEELKMVLKEGYGKGSGIGLSNVMARIKNIFGPEYGLTMESEENTGTEVVIKVPLQTIKREENTPWKCRL